MRLLPVVVAVGILSTHLAIAGTLEERAAASRAAAKEFQDRLQAELMEAMKVGPVNAIEVCSKKAPAIAAELSQQHGWRIGRTSTRLRNPANAPDEWEKKVLELLDLRKRRGEGPDTLEFYEIVESGGKKEFRYMKAIAIPKGAPCLLCHGTVIDAKVDAKLKQLYPADQARGYREGDLRGAFTIRQPL